MEGDKWGGAYHIDSMLQRPEAPQGRTNFVWDMGSPISSATTVPLYFGFTSTDNR